MSKSPQLEPNVNDEQSNSLWLSSFGSKVHTGRQLRNNGANLKCIADRYTLCVCVIAAMLDLQRLKTCLLHNKLE